MKCKQCGQEINKGNHFCIKCGNPIPKTSNKKLLYLGIGGIVVLVLGYFLLMYHPIPQEVTLTIEKLSPLLLNHNADKYYEKDITVEGHYAGYDEEYGLGILYQNHEHPDVTIPFRTNEKVDVQYIGEKLILKGRISQVGGGTEEDESKMQFLNVKHVTYPDTKKLTTYTIDELYEEYQELVNQEIVVEGYVSPNINEKENAIFLTNQTSDYLIDTRLMKTEIFDPTYWDEELMDGYQVVLKGTLKKSNQQYYIEGIIVETKEKYDIKEYQENDYKNMVETTYQDYPIGRYITKEDKIFIRKGPDNKKYDVVASDEFNGDIKKDKQALVAKETLFDISEIVVNDTGVWGRIEEKEAWICIHYAGSNFNGNRDFCEFYEVLPAYMNVHDVIEVVSDDTYLKEKVVIQGYYPKYFRKDENGNDMHTLFCNESEEYIILTGHLPTYEDCQIRVYGEVNKKNDKYYINVLGTFGLE